MKKLLIAGFSALLLSGAGFAIASDGSTAKVTTCQCTDCSCDNCGCTDCGNGSCTCDDSCCSEAKGCDKASADCCAKH